MARRFMFKDRNLLYTMTIGGGLSFTIPYWIHTFGIKKYVSYYEKYRPDGLPVFLSPKVEKRYTDVVDDFKFNKLERLLIEIFVTNNLNMFCAGSTKSQYGIFVGVPETFLCETEEEVTSLDILIDGKPVPWECTDGKLLADSLILSENAQKYAIAKYIELGNNYCLLINSALPVMLSIILQQCLIKIKNKLKLNQKPFMAKVYMNSIIFIVFLCFWYFLYDCINMLYDKNTEDNVIELGRSYVIGGIEYYTKLMQKNQAIGKLSEKYYAVSENNQYLFRQKGMSLMSKKLYLEQTLKKDYDEEEFRMIPIPRTPH